MSILTWVHILRRFGEGSKLAAWASTSTALVANNANHMKGTTTATSGHQQQSCKGRSVHQVDCEGR
jgi:hypothetical protein